MFTKEFDYNLPEKFIAQNPVNPRDHSKLMSINSEEIKHLQFFQIKEILKKGDLLVVNSSKVIKARITFDQNKKEIFLLKKLRPDTWNCLVRPGKKFKVNNEFSITKNLKAKIESIEEDGSRNIIFSGQDSNKVEIIGQTPLPPYIKNSESNEQQYQTVYAKEQGSVAAPTAGLHFTENLIKELKNQGVKIIDVTLHVGRGTFLPVSTEKITDHKMHSEDYYLSQKSANILNETLKEKGRIIAVGTTSVRVLESCYDKKLGFQESNGSTEIFIYPGKHQWKVVDGLITNFHLPKSTLLMLVASFLEHKGNKKAIERLLEIYEIAKKENYRFYSFGDAMLIL